MPLPKPKKDEPEDKFISRCMDNKTMKKEFPNNKQRIAVCYIQFRGEKENSEKNKMAMEKGKKITITARDPDNNLKNMLEHLKAQGSIGHSFRIIMDPDGDKKEFTWDGDGPDTILDMKEEEVKNMSEENEKKEDKEMFGNIDNPEDPDDINSLDDFIDAFTGGKKDDNQEQGEQKEKNE